jgi:hypothetical protein
VPGAGFSCLDPIPFRASGWHDVRVQHADTWIPAILFDDLKTTAIRIREWYAGLLRQLTVQHVSLQWMEQHKRDSPKH